MTADGPGNPDTRRLYVWEYGLHPVRGPESGGVNGAVLAALRRGVGREAGTVPEMWPHYRTLSGDGRLTEELRAEHLALTLFAVHQQSRPARVHRRSVGVGTAMAVLRDSGKFSEQAIERRFAAFATATSLTEAGSHLRGLITQLRVIDQGIDYTKLMADLVEWQFPASVGTVRRRWGMQFFLSRKAEQPERTEKSGPTEERAGQS